MLETSHQVSQKALKHTEMFVEEVVNVNDKLVRGLANYGLNRKIHNSSKAYKSKHRLMSLSGSREKAHQTYDMGSRLNESLQIGHY